MLTICVSAHHGYRDRLGAVCESFDQQIEALSDYFIEAPARFLAFDTAEGPAPEPPYGWQLLSGRWRNPSPGRNAVLERAQTDWILYWDADNPVPPNLIGYALREISATPDRRLAHQDAHIGPLARPSVDPRIFPHIDTSALWNAHALRAVGGWGAWRVEDWELGARLHRAGWQFRQGLSAQNVRAMHDEQRSKNARPIEKHWSAKRLAIITLFRPGAWARDHGARWRAALSEMDLPARPSALILGIPECAPQLPKNIAARFDQITILKTGAPSEGEDRALHIARLYQRALPICAPSHDWILTWEDDVIPRRPKRAIWTLAAHLTNPKTAAAGGVYEARSQPGRACASTMRRGWDFPLINHLPGACAAQRLGGGFTLWSAAHLQRAPLLGAIPALNGSMRGWDDLLCTHLLQKKLRLSLIADVPCDHHWV